MSPAVRCPDLSSGCSSFWDFPVSILGNKHPEGRYKITSGCFGPLPRWLNAFDRVILRMRSEQESNEIKTKQNHKNLTAEK